ncbi:MAG: nucleotide-binding universal stress UspA family protein [Crocinitomix sp.]|jgi:nucleotide-binding universal stress UspA family protein
MKLLIPTDYSQNSLKAFSFIYKLYQTSITDYVFLNIQNARHAGSMLSLDLNHEMTLKSNAKMDELINKIRSDYPWIQVSGIVSAGTFIDSVVEKISEFSIDCVAIGTKGENSISHKLIGSNAVELIGYCTKPLFVVPNEADLTKAENVMLAADFDQEARPETYDALLDLCYKNKCHLDILHVAKPNSKHFSEKDIPFNTEGLNYKLTERTDMNVEYAIMDFIGKNDIDLITTVRSKGGFIHDLFHSSLTKKLSMHSETPLLVLV